jgi:hypothetical protein
MRRNSPTKTSELLRRTLIRIVSCALFRSLRSVIRPGVMSKPRRVRLSRAINSELAAGVGLLEAETHLTA